MAEVDWFPKAQEKPIGIQEIIPDAIGSRSMKINPWIYHPRCAATLTKTRSDWQLRLRDGNIRKPNIDEVKLLCSFPKSFACHSWGQLGNSVPPLMMQAIAAQISFLFFGFDEIKTSKMDYPAILEEAWQQHLAPRISDAPTIISTFAGCGGSSLGYSMAGYRELLAIEWNDNAVAIFKLNFPGIPVYHGDIHELKVEQCLKLAGIKAGELDLLDGSPPCQGFSTAGKRQMDDKRNQLYMEFVRLLRGLRPKVFVMENVSGLVKGKMKLIFADIMRELKASGYKVRCKLLNAMYFNVPQSRQRLIFIGVDDH
ncbi:MAG: DNA (cytosine-5-)-methyltransferase [Planctomycetes bacterium]|nr:DNA (cytosine-5-)-methyltransferase [Planctomycetota bacterium]